MKWRVLAFLFAAALAAGDAMDDAVAQWAKKISTHLAADEIGHVTWNETGASDANLNRVKPLLARALQRRVRNPKTVEITARLTQNLKSYLLIAEIHRENEPAVEMASVPRAPAATVAAGGFRLDRRLVWEQEAPILDVFTAGDQMLVLDTTGVSRYEQRESKWQKAEAAAFDVPPVRDPRGRLTLREDSLVAEVPGFICRGDWKPAMSLDCQPGGRFTAERNTIEEAGWPAYFTRGELGGDQVIAEADGHTYIYDAARQQLGVSNGWTDFAVVSSGCTGAKIIASESNSVAIFDLANHNPVRVSDSTEVPGPVTAMWSEGSSALAVVRNKNTNRYEAYSLGVDCGH